MTTDDLLTTAEAAAIADVQPDAIRRAVRDGRLPAVQRGPLWLIRRSDLDGYKPVRKPRRSVQVASNRSIIGNTRSSSTAHRWARAARAEGKIGVMVDRDADGWYTVTYVLGGSRL